MRVSRTLICADNSYVARDSGAISVRHKRFSVRPVISASYPVPTVYIDSQMPMAK
jgi:hypothetical protein